MAYPVPPQAGAGRLRKRDTMHAMAVEGPQGKSKTGLAGGCSGDHALECQLVVLQLQALRQLQAVRLHSG